MLSYKFLRICGFVQDDNPVSRQGQADERTCIPQSLRNISLAWCSISSLPYWCESRSKYLQVCIVGTWRLWPKKGWALGPGGYLAWLAEPMTRRHARAPRTIAAVARYQIDMVKQRRAYTSRWRVTNYILMSVQSLLGRPTDGHRILSSGRAFLRSALPYHRL